MNYFIVKLRTKRCDGKNFCTHMVSEVLLDTSWTIMLAYCRSTGRTMISGVRLDQMEIDHTRDLKRSWVYEMLLQITAYKICI